MLDWSRERLADAAGISERTLIDFERGARSPVPATLAAIRRALEEAGVEFIERGVRLRDGVKPVEKDARTITPED